MTAILGIFLVLLGGFSNGSFYIPFKRVKTWSWEVYWFVGGVFSWIIAPWLFGVFTVPDLFGVFGDANAMEMIKPLIFGVLWGVGGLTFGLAMRYLGVALGMAIALGLTLVFGALLPPIFVAVAPGIFFDLFPNATPLGVLVTTNYGLVTLLGVLVCIIGISICGKAGMMKDAEVSEEKKKASIRDFDMKKGILVALFAGLMSAAFAMGVEAGKPLVKYTELRGANPIFQNNPSFILIMFGGFLVNAFWCFYLQAKNKTAGDFAKPPLLNNYFFSALAGTLWYLQMFFYGMGESMIGGVAGWSLLMASSILFSNMWGLLTKEWQGVKKKTYVVLSIGLFVLVISTVVFGYGKHLKDKSDVPGDVAKVEVVE